MSLFAAYGSAPVAAIIFSLLSISATAVGAALGLENYTAVDLALYLNAISFFVSAITIARLEIPKDHIHLNRKTPSLTDSLLDGAKFIFKTKLIRGLIIGMIGAFLAAGAVIGLARTFVGDLNAGDAAYGILFGAVFTGLAGGMH